VFWCILNAIFYVTSREKILNYLPEVVIWWTLKMYCPEVVNSLSESWGW